MAEIKRCRCGYELNVPWGNWLLRQHTATHNMESNYCKKGDWHI